jgi:AcrR family transcriptional regulator
MVKLSFREQVLQARESALIDSVNRLLAEKGFEAMTVDEVAADVGIAKASLYKHFGSKEELAAAAMIRVLDKALAFLDELESAEVRSAFDRLKAVARWTMQAQLAGEMPALPAQNSSLRSALASNRTYVDRLVRVSEKLGEWITEAQASGQLQSLLPPEVILYTLFARACDPVIGVLKATGQYDDERILDCLIAATFDGIGAGPRRCLTGSPERLQVAPKRSTASR